MVVKWKKNPCIYSLGSSNKQSLKNSKCENYQKLIENEKQSCVLQENIEIKE